MAHIYIRGRQDPIDVSREDALKIKKAKDANLPANYSVPLKNASWSLGEIKGVVLDVEEREDTSFDEMHARCIESREIFKKLPMDKKVNSSIQHFRMFFWAMTGDQPEADDIANVSDKLEEFFTQNPRWVVPSLLVYKDLIPKEIKIKKDLWRETSLRILENCEHTEVKMTGGLKNKEVEKEESKLEF